MKVEEFRKNVYIYKQGETARKFYIILGGLVSIRGSKKEMSNNVKIFKETGRSEGRKTTFAQMMKKTEVKG